MARGYFGRPDLTAERFVPNPFATRDEFAHVQDRRLLPLAVRMANWNIWGAWTTRSKLRGFRIELGEIEAVLAKHASVHQCLVMAREDTPGDQAAGGVRGAGGREAVEDEELRAHLKQSLPEFMLPSAFVALQQFPLTPNGKIDRKALPAPEYKRSGKNTLLRARPMEERCRRHLGGVLRIAEVGTTMISSLWADTHCWRRR